MFNDIARKPYHFACLTLLYAFWTTTVLYAADEKPAEYYVDPQVQKLLDKHLRIDPNYSEGDILARDQIEPIYNELLERGLKPTLDGESAYTPILRESHFLVQLLRTPQGRAFMKQIGHKPLVYDRLDRLTWLTGGQNWVQQIVASPEGGALLDRLFSEEGLKAIERQFANETPSRNMNLPTGKIYTEAALGAELTRTLRKQLEKKSATTQQSTKSAPSGSSTSAKAKKAAGA